MAASVGVEIGDPLESRVAWLLGGLRGVPVLAELSLITVLIAPRLQYRKVLHGSDVSAISPSRATLL